MTSKRTKLFTAGYRGFSLIEVLVALLALSIGLLGLAALQTTSLQYNTGSYYRTQATLLAYDIIDRMRANGDAVISGGGYDVGDVSTVSSTNNCDTTSCSSTELAAFDLSKWFARAAATLPIAQVPPPTVTVDASRQARVTINWTERDLTMNQSWNVQVCVSGVTCR